MRRGEESGRLAREHGPELRVRVGLAVVGEEPQGDGPRRRVDVGALDERRQELLGARRVDDRVEDDGEVVDAVVAGAAVVEEAVGQARVPEAALDLGRVVVVDVVRPAVEVAVDVKRRVVAEGAPVAVARAVVRAPVLQRVAHGVARGHAPRARRHLDARLLHDEAVLHDRGLREGPHAELAVFQVREHDVALGVPAPAVVAVRQRRLVRHREGDAPRERRLRAFGARERRHEVLDVGAVEGRRVRHRVRVPRDLEAQPVERREIERKGHGRLDLDLRDGGDRGRVDVDARARDGRADLGQSRGAAAHDGHGRLDRVAPGVGRVRRVPRRRAPKVWIAAAVTAVVRAAERVEVHVAEAVAPAAEVAGRHAQGEPRDGPAGKRGARRVLGEVEARR